MCSSNSRLREEFHKRIEGKNLSYAKEIADYCWRVCSQFRPQLIILHGSTARRMDGKWSDVDLLVIADFDIPLIERVERLLELNQTRAPIEPLGYTPKEFKSMLRRLNPLALEAIEKGVPIVGENLFSSLKSWLEKAKKRRVLKKTKIGWTTI